MPKTKKAIAQAMGIARSTLYYKPKLPARDWSLKIQIEKILRIRPSYGHRRISQELKINKKRILRVMSLFGIKPYRRRGKRPRKPKDENRIPMPYPNLLLLNFPSQPNRIWVSDFTHIRWRNGWIYLATVMDLFTRTVVGWHILAKHTTDLVAGALTTAVNNYSKPEILHSDQGSEYASKRYTGFAEQFGILISMSKKSSPWENGYQESFYSQFKIDLGDSNRFASLGELIEAIHYQIYFYNNLRIHTALKMPPAEYAKRHLLLKQRSPPIPTGTRRKSV
jgi:putative transposase